MKLYHEGRDEHLDDEYHYQKFLDEQQQYYEQHPESPANNQGTTN